LSSSRKITDCPHHRRPRQIADRFGLAGFNDGFDVLAGHPDVFRRVVLVGQECPEVGQVFADRPPGFLGVAVLALASMWPRFRRFAS
jgi:hypothetical protein